MSPSLRRCLLAEALGTAGLALFGTGAAVVNDQSRARGRCGDVWSGGLR